MMRHGQFYTLNIDVCYEDKLFLEWNLFKQYLKFNNKNENFYENFYELFMII